MKFRQRFSIKFRAEATTLVKLQTLSAKKVAKHHSRRFQFLLLKPFYVLILCLYSQIAFADLIVKQTRTNKDDVNQITQYLSGSMFRIDMKTKDTELISIFKNPKIITCQKLRNSREKGSCTIADIAQAKALIGMATIEVKEHETKKLEQTGRFIGRSCQYYQRKLALDVSIMGVMTSSKTIDKYCVDKSLKIPVEFIAYQLNSALGGTMAKKQLNEFISKEENAAGLILYQKSEVDSKSQVKAVQSMAKMFGGDARTNGKSTIITKTISVKQIQIPESRFQIPLGDYEVVDFTKKNAP